MTQTIEDLIPDYLRGLPVYVPGKPIEEVERELKIHAVKLASNENPLGPSPKAMVAARAVLGDSNRYPDGARTHCGKLWRSAGVFRRKRFLLDWGRASLLILRRGRSCERDFRG